MQITTVFTAEREFHDAHIASLEQACETPGGYSREYLTAARTVARDILASYPRNPVTTDGPGYLVQHRIGQRIAETRQMKAIVAECNVLLDGVPCEFDEAASELDAWLEEAGASFETRVGSVMRGRAA